MEHHLLFCRTEDDLARSKVAVTAMHEKYRKSIRDDRALRCSKCWSSSQSWGCWRRRPSWSRRRSRGTPAPRLGSGRRWMLCEGPRDGDQPAPECASRRSSGLTRMQTLRVDIGAGGVVTGTTIAADGGVREPHAVPARTRRARHAGRVRQGQRSAVAFGPVGHAGCSRAKAPSSTRQGDVLNGTVFLSIQRRQAQPESDHDLRGDGAYSGVALERT